MRHYETRTCTTLFLNKIPKIRTPSFVNFNGHHHYFLNYDILSGIAYNHKLLIPSDTVIVPTVLVEQFLRIFFFFLCEPR